LPIPIGLFNVPAKLNRLGSRLFGYEPMLTPEKLNELRHPDWVCDSVALTEAIGWQPNVRLKEGLRRTPGWCSRLE
jgi:nucleoside-diphosphate-sugar epimerase